MSSSYQRHAPYYGQYHPNISTWLQHKTNSHLRSCYFKHICDTPHPSGNVQTVLFLHGATECIEKYEHFYHTLNTKGFDVVAIDFKTYGLSHNLHASRFHINDFSDFHNDLHTAIAWAKSCTRTPIPSIHFVSHSFSGAILLRALQEEKIPSNSKVVFLSPMWGIALPYPEPFVYQVMHIASFLHPQMRIPKPQIKDLASHPCLNSPRAWDFVQRLYLNHPELHRSGNTVQWIFHALKEIRAINAGPPPKQAALCLYAQNELITRNDAILAWKKKWTLLDILEIPNTKHELLSTGGATYKAIVDCICSYLNHSNHQANINHDWTAKKAA